jgi:flagellar biosynthesis/type III secretory pathway protein FliH
MAFRHPARDGQNGSGGASWRPARAFDDARQALEEDRSRLAAERDAFEAERERLRRAAEERGYRDGQAKARSEYEETVKPSLLGVIEELRQRVGDLELMLREAEPRIVALLCEHAIELARRLIGAHYQQSPESIVQSLAPLLREAAAERQAGQAILCVAHPDTLRLLSAVAGDLGASGLVLTPDDTLRPGGAKLIIRDIDINRTVAEWDATIERRIADLGIPA